MSFFELSKSPFGFYINCSSLSEDKSDKILWLSLAEIILMTGPGAISAADPPSFFPNYTRHKLYHPGGAPGAVLPGSEEWSRAQI